MPIVHYAHEKCVVEIKPDIAGCPDVTTLLPDYTGQNHKYGSLPLSCDFMLAPRDHPKSPTCCTRRISEAAAATRARKSTVAQLLYNMEAPEHDMMIAVFLAVTSSF